MAVFEDEPEIRMNLPANGSTSRIAAAINRLVLSIARHWLALFNIFVAIFIALPVLAPVFMDAGATGLGRLIYTIYSPTCHQLPERSFFLFGPQVAYQLDELEHAHVVPPGLNLFQRQLLRVPGNAEAGYKMAFCQRDLAMYGGILLTGLVYGAIRGPGARRRKVPKLPLWGYALFLLPMAIDGTTQLFSLRESTWGLRLITGLLFGFATVWLAYPYVQEAMDEVLESAPPTAQRSVEKTP